MDKAETSESILSRLYSDLEPDKNAGQQRIESVEFRREQYGLSRYQFAALLGMGNGHYYDFCNGKRDLTLKAIRRAYAIGVPAEVLLKI